MTDINRKKNGHFSLGNPGRQVGSKNHKLRDDIRTFMQDSWQEFPEWFNELKPKDKIETMLSLMPYVVSRLQSVSMTDTDGAPIERATIDFSKLSQSTLTEILAHTHINENEHE